MKRMGNDSTVQNRRMSVMSRLSIGEGNISHRKTTRASYYSHSILSIYTSSEGQI